MNGFDGVTTRVWGGTNEGEGAGSISWGEGVRIRTCVWCGWETRMGEKG